MNFCLPAVRYLVAPLVNGDTLPVIAGELSRAAGGHLDPDQLGGEGGGAGVVHHAGEVKHVHTQQQGGLQRVAGIYSSHFQCYSGIHPLPYNITYNTILLATLLPSFISNHSQSCWSSSNWMELVLCPRNLSLPASVMVRV